MTTAGPPTEIEARKAAETLGITETELAQTLQTLATDRLVRLATKIERFEVSTLDDFDEHVAGARNVFESLLAAWAVIDASPDDSEED